MVGVDVGVEVRWGKGELDGVKERGDRGRVSRWSRVRVRRWGKGEGKGEARQGKEGGGGEEEGGVSGARGRPWVWGGSLAQRGDGDTVEWQSGKPVAWQCATLSPLHHTTQLPSTMRPRQHLLLAPYLAKISSKTSTMDPQQIRAQRRPDPCQ